MNIKKNKKIAFLIPSLSSGGMERVMSEVVNYVSSEYPLIECHLIIYSKVDIDFYSINERVIIHKPQFVFNETYRTISTLKTIRFIRSTIKSIDPISILSFGEYWNNLVLLSTYKLKVPVYISERSSPNISLGKIQECLRRYLYPKAKGIIAQTTIAQNIFEKRNYNKNIVVIGNPIRSIEQNNDFVRENIIVSVGRLIDTKHFDRLINIFANINNRDWKLIIIGGDSDKQTNSVLLDKRIKELGMSDNIILAGRQSNVVEYLLKASIFAFTSSSEGFPNVIGEAMSAGLSVIAYDCVAGPSDMIVNEENGYLIPLFDDEEFKLKLASLMNNKDVRELMGDKAKQSIQKFSKDKICEQFFNFITAK